MNVTEITYLLLLVGSVVFLFILLDRHQKKSILKAMAPAEILLNGKLTTSLMRSGRTVVGTYKQKEAMCELYLADKRRSYTIAMKLNHLADDFDLENTYKDFSKLVYLENDFLCWKDANNAVSLFSIMKNLKKYNENELPLILEKLYEIVSKIENE